MRERATTRWVFKKGEELYGPVDAEYLAERLRAGEIGPDTLVAPEHGAFAPIGTVEPFVALAAEVAVQKRREAEAARRTARRRLWAGVAVAAVLAVAGLVAALGREDPLARRELAAISIEALPMEVRMVDEAAEDEEVYRDLAPAGVGVPRQVAPGTRRRPTPGNADDLTIETRYDAAAIERVVAARRNRLLPCLRAQAERDPAFRGEVPLSFVVGNDGKVARLWVDRVGYREGPLHACLLEELRSWTFPPFEGQRPAISLRFRVGG